MKKEKQQKKSQIKPGIIRVYIGDILTHNFDKTSKDHVIYNFKGTFISIMELTFYTWRNLNSFTKDEQ